MRLFVACIFIALALGSVQCRRERVFSGVVLQNGYAHKFNASEPLDSNKIVIAVTGTANRGLFKLDITAPMDFCPFGPISCGRQVQNISVEVESRKGVLSLKSMVNNPSPGTFGVASQYYALGVRNQEKTELDISYNLQMVIGTTYEIPFKSIFAGHIDRNNVFIGKQFGFVIPYDGTKYNGEHPYQYLITYGEIDSSQPFSFLSGYRIISPYGSVTEPGYPPSPYGVFGDVSSVTFSGGMIRGTMNLKTKAINHEFSLDNAEFFGNYQYIHENRNHIRIVAGVAVQGQNAAYLDNLEILLGEC